MAKQSNWRMWLHEATEMRKEGAALAFERAQRYVKMYQSDDFHDFCAKDNKTPENFLDDECADLCINFQNLRAILEQFPRKPKWRATRLDLLLQEAKKLIQGEREKPEPTRRNPPITRAEFEKMKQDRDVYAEQVSKVEAELDALRKENMQLREENARLEGRIQELERMLKLQTQAA